VSRATATTALRDLAEHDLIRRAGGAGTFSTTVYELCPVSRTDLPLSRREESVLTSGHLDVWRHRDLGSTGLLIFATLTDDGQTVADLTDATRLARSTVSRRLKQLEARGLASKQDGTWLRGWSDPSEVVGPARGTARREVERFARERAVYRRQSGREVAS
jgi:DNA-binding HxlR family transcriptional regulator